MTLTYHSLPARSGQTRGLVILLHGFGANGAAMLGLGRSLSASLPDITFIAPDAPAEVPGQAAGRMWYSIPELDGSGAGEVDMRLQASARQVDSFLDSQLVAHDLTASSLALLGFSQGAGLAYEIGPRRPDQLAGVVAIAGRMKRKEALSAEIRSRPPFLILTGAHDRLLDSEEITQSVATLSKAGIPTQRINMEGAGHGISGEGLHAAGAFLGSVIFHEGTI